MDYIDRIKKVKNEKKVTNEQLSEMTGIPLGTLSKILAGISDSPKLSSIVAIADALGCTVDYIVSGVPENRNNYTLSAEEIQWIERYRALDDHGKELLELILEKELERVAPNGAVAELEEEWVERPRSYMDASGGLRRRSVMLYDLPVSAGQGVYLDDSAAGSISIPDHADTESADFAVRISGNSMMPRYRDGDILLVEDCDSVEVGELGIFVLDGDGYFKKYGGDRLISLNSAYGDILLRSFSEAVCCGRVIGKLKRR